jgi:hypothetical protein
MCPTCNYWFSTPAASTYESVQSGFNKRQIVAFAGAALLLIGLFTPLVGVPFFTVNYYNLSQISSLAGLGFFLLLLCGAGAGVLAGLKRYGVLKWPGLAALLILAYTFYSIRSGIAQARNEMAKSMASMPDGQNNPFKGMGEAFMSIIQMQWGWGVLSIGAILLIVAGLMKDEA